MSWLRVNRWAVAAVVVALAVVVVGKEYYRTATAADLRWILAPTAQLVSWVTGGDFVYEAGPGWVDRDIGFIIAPVCAGVNFALAAFLALTLGGLRAMTSARHTALRLVRAAVFAYAATLVVNTIRIAIAVAMHRRNFSGMDRDQLHTIEGIVVYFGGLCALYAVARAVTEPVRRSKRPPARGTAGSGRAGAGGGRERGPSEVPDEARRQHAAAA